MNPTVKFEDYRFEIRPLSEEEGGGFLLSFPDLPGCVSDGEDYEQAINNARDAFAAWVAAHEEQGREIPLPNGQGKPARFVLRLPRSLHDRLSLAATTEGTSANTLVAIFIAEGLARRERPPTPSDASLSTKELSPRLAAYSSALGKAGPLSQPDGTTTAVSARSTMVEVIGGKFAANVSADADAVVVPIRRRHR